MKKLGEIYSSRIESALEEFYDRYSHLPSLYSPTQYILSLGGKRIRPALVLMAAESFGGTIDKAIDAALAIEVFHNFTLVHDDIMDHASMRRGRETVHKRWNENTAILSGDVMMIQAYELFEHYDKKTFKAVIKVFNSVARYVCEGQQMDMDFEKESDVTMAQYLRMIELKTAVLLGGALAIGAIVADASAKDVDNLYDFGRYIGIAFQLRDDYLDTYGDASTFGKRIGGDIVEGKKTFLYIHTRNRCSAIEEFDRAFAIEDEESRIERVRELFTAKGADVAICAEIERFTAKALECVERMPFSGEVKERYRQLAHTLVGRTK
ncbi:MAG: polyprenyl synthetase family protein [Flavobacteriales bacterium]|nr:polyprenyl synthetase family protein [Flavobacteriales bacterium]